MISCDDSFLNADLKSKNDKETIHLQSTTQTKLFIMRTILICNQLCIYFVVWIWSDQIKQKKEACHREGLVLSEVDLTNLIYRKGLTASRDWVRDSKDNKIISQMSQDAAFSTEVCKVQLFATRPSIKNEVSWTLVCRELTQSRDNPDWNLVCALKDNLRIGYKDNEFDRITSHWHLDTDEKESPQLFMDTHQ